MLDNVKRVLWTAWKSSARFLLVVLLAGLAYLSQGEGYTLAATVYAIFALGMLFLTLNEIRHRWTQAKFRFGSIDAST